MGVPKVSILVPVYNVEKYIHRCVDSIIAQTFTDFECILVDDCSPDKCPEICDNYARQDARIMVIHKAQNEGLPQARKTGFEISSGKYIQFVDSDDWIEPDMIKKLYTAAIESDADIVACDHYKDYSKSYVYTKQKINTNNIFSNMGFIIGCYVWDKFYKREIIKYIIFPIKNNYEDRVITQQAIFFSKNIIKIPYPLYHYSYNQDSMSNSNSIKRYSEHRDNILIVIDFLRNNLGEKYKLKENEVNTYVNIIKLKVLKNKCLRKDKSLINFYPESKFKRWLFLHLLKNAIKMTIPHGFYVFFRKYKKVEIEDREKS